MIAVDEISYFREQGLYRRGHKSHRVYPVLLLKTNAEETESGLCLYERRSGTGFLITRLLT